MTLGTQTQPYGKLLDYEQFIDHQLERTRARIKFTDIMTAGLMLLVGFLAVLFLEVVLDHMVGLPLLLRRVVLAAGLTAAAAFCAVRIAMPLLRRINGIYAAKTIEDADPGFKNSLINYLELRRYRGQMPKAVMATLEVRAVTDLTQVEIETVVNQQRLLRVFYALSAVAVIFSLYALFSPKSILDSTRRAFLADVVRPTNTQLLNIKPGADRKLSEVVAGDHVTFSVHVEGIRPQKVLLHYSVDDGKFFAIREFTPGRLMYDPWQVTLTNVQQSMDYFLTGGDAESLHYHLEVLPAPTITSIAVDLEFPQYTKVPPRTNVEGGNVEAIEGTTVKVHARTNMPAGIANLDRSDGNIAPMNIATDDPTILTGTFVVKTSGTYKINFKTTGNQYNPNPVVYDIVAIPDRAPTAKFVRPEKPTVSVPANIVVELAMTGSDDHGIKDATLHVTMGNDKLVSKNLLEGRPPQAELKAFESLDLAKLRVKPGAKLNYWLTVRDNKEPSSNRFDTAHQLIEVVEPVSPADKKKLEDDQKNDPQQVDPTAASAPEEESGKDKTSPSEPTKAGEENGNNRGSGQQDDQKLEKQNGEQGAQGAGAVDDTTQNPKSGGANDAQSQLSPEDQRTEEKLRDLLKNKNASNQPANQNNPVKSPQNNGNPPPADQGTPDKSQANGNSDRSSQGSDRTPGKAQQRPAVENPGSSSAQNAPPPQANNGLDDPSNRVQRADRDGDQSSVARGRDGNNKRDPAANQSGRPDQTNMGDKPESSGAPKSASNPNPTPGDNPSSKESNTGKAGDQSANPSANVNQNGSNGQRQEQPSNTKSEGAQESKPNGDRSGTADNKPADGANNAGSKGEEAGDRSSSAKSADSHKNEPKGEVGEQTGKPSDETNKEGTKREAGDRSSNAKSADSPKNQPNGEAGNQTGKPSDKTNKEGNNGEAGDRSSSTKSADSPKNQPNGEAGNQTGKPSDEVNKEGAKGEAGDRSSNSKSADSPKNQPKGEGPNAESKPSDGTKQEGAGQRGDQGSNDKSADPQAKNAQDGKAGTTSGNQTKPGQPENKANESPKGQSSDPAGDGQSGQKEGSPGSKSDSKPGGQSMPGKNTNQGQNTAQQPGSSATQNQTNSPQPQTAAATRRPRINSRRTRPRLIPLSRGRIRKHLQRIAPAPKKKKRISPETMASLPTPTRRNPKMRQRARRPIAAMIRVLMARPSRTTPTIGKLRMARIGKPQTIRRMAANHAAPPISSPSPARPGQVIRSNT